MKKINNLSKFLIILVLIQNFAWTQTEDKTSTEIPTPSKNKTEEKGKWNQNNANQIDPLKEFRHLPHQDLEKDFVSEDFEEKIFAKIKGYIDQSKNEVYSFFMTLQRSETDIQNQIRSSGNAYHYISPSIQTNVYNKLVNFDKIRNHYYLDRTIRRLLEVEKLYNFSHDALKYVFSEQELKDVVYDMQSLLGVLYLYKGLPHELHLSIEKFKYLLGFNPIKYNFVEGNAERTKMVYEHMVSIYTYLYFYHIKNGRSSISDKYKLSRLEYTWKLLEINYKNKPNILAIKQKRLLDKKKFPIKLLSRSKLYPEFVTRFAKITQTDIIEKISGSTTSGNIDTAPSN